MAASNASATAAGGFWSPLTLRTYWRAAASISSAVAGGSRPRSSVMLRHMPVRLRGLPEMHGGQGPERSPPLGGGGEGFGIEASGPLQAEVGDREGVGVPGAQGEVVGRPRAKAPHG